MYVTRIMDGRPVQAFVPKPMLPSLPGETLQVFREIDGALLLRLDGMRFVDFCSTAVAQVGRSPFDESKRHRVEAACAQFLRVARFDSRVLAATNAQLTGASQGSLRRSHAWMGGAHPASAWHVGSPADQLPSLVKGIVRLQSRDLPASLIALVSMLRLLQVHPFADGNGRTARLYACWLVQRYLGPALLFPRLIDALWSISHFDLLAASNELRDEGSLDLLRDYVIDVIDDLHQPTKGIMRE